MYERYYISVLFLVKSEITSFVDEIKKKREKNKTCYFSNTHYHIYSKKEKSMQITPHAEEDLNVPDNH